MPAAYLGAAAEKSGAAKLPCLCLLDQAADIIYACWHMRPGGSLQEPYQNAHPVPSEDVSAQTGFAAQESDAEDSALSSPRRLDRSSTVFYDVGA